MNDFGFTKKRPRYFKTNRDRLQLKSLLEVECMTLADAAEEMKIPEYVIRAAAVRYGIAFHHRRTYWTQRDNNVLAEWFKKTQAGLPDKTAKQIVTRLANIHVKGLRGR